MLCTSEQCASSALPPSERQVVVLRAGDGLLNNGGDAARLYNADGELVRPIAPNCSQLIPIDPN
eukprot:SAG31_NODE_3334_length_4394_cov_2.169034_2_plen_64_part_00